MKQVVFSSLGKCLLMVPIALAISGCASKINHDLYAVNPDKTDPTIEVVRDGKTSNSTAQNTETCQTNFYINQVKVGSFASHDVSTYQLPTGLYHFAVDNCQGRCSKYGLDVEIQQGKTQKFTLSADATGKPFIIVNQ